MEKQFIFETAKRLEEVCKRRKAHDFYHRLKSGESWLFDFWKLENWARVHKREHVKFPEIELTLAQIQDVVFDFYKSLDGQLFENLQKVLNNPFFEHRFNEPSPSGHKNAVGFNYDNSTGKPVDGVIDLNPRNTVEGYVVVAHEGAHTLEERNQKLMRQKTDCLGEIASLFVEKLFGDYLLSKGIITTEERSALRCRQETNLIRNVNILIEEEEILRQLDIPISGEQLFGLQEKYQGTMRGEILQRRIGEMINGDGNQEVYGERMFRYVVGGFVSEALYQDFKKTPQQTLERFKEFLEHNAEMDENEAYQTLLGENYAQKVERVMQDNQKSKE